MKIYSYLRGLAYFDLSELHLASLSQKLPRLDKIDSVKGLFIRPLLILDHIEVARLVFGGYLTSVMVVTSRTKAAYFIRTERDACRYTQLLRL